jgi:hypothetical protein
LVVVPVAHFAYTSSNAPRLTPAFAIKPSFHRKTLQASRLWAMGEHYIEMWLSYDPITDFVPECNTLFTSAAPSPGRKQLVFIRPYDICTDASLRWCLTGPQGRVRAVLYWGSPSPLFAKNSEWP